MPPRVPFFALLPLFLGGGGRNFVGIMRVFSAEAHARFLWCKKAKGKKTAAAPSFCSFRFSFGLVWGGEVPRVRVGG